MVGGAGSIRQGLRSAHRYAKEAALDDAISHCRVGDYVEALYAPTGEYSDAKITDIGGNGTVTVQWPDKRPCYRHLPIENAKKDGISCGKEEPPKKWGREARNAMERKPKNFGREADSRASEDVVHFLFLIDDSLPHLELWEKFFADAPAGSWRAWVHCKEPAGCRDQGLHRLPGFAMTPTTPTWYCHDLVTAMAQLLRSALLPLRGSPQGRLEKFVFLSDSTLPIKPFREIHHVLTSDDDSDFCIFPQQQWGSGEFNGHEALLVKHHQWLTLNRRHAELFVREWKPVDAEGFWAVPLKSGPWVEHEREVEPKDFSHPPNSNWCTDEWAFFATIFGAVEDKRTGVQYLSGFGGGALQLTGQLAKETQGRCRTFAYWGNTDGPDFAFLATEVYNDWDSEISCYPTCHSRPATFRKLGLKGLQAMRKSSFLFVRKISDHIMLEDYDVAILNN